MRDDIKGSEGKRLIKGDATALLRGQKGRDDPCFFQIAL